MEFTGASQVSTGVLFLLSCWNTALRPSLRREGIMLCFSMSQYMLVFMVPSMNCSSPVPAAHAASDHDTPTTMLDCMQDTLLFVILTWLPPHTLDTIWTKYVYLGLIRPQDMVPEIHVLSLLVFSLRAFLCIIFRRGFLLGRQPCRPIFDAVCGIWSEHWQADPPPLQPLQQCWQHSYIYLPNTTSGYDAEHVHSTFLVDHDEACSEWNLSC